MAWTGEAASGAVAILIALYAMHRDNKKERDAVAKAIEKRDEKLDFILQEHPLHTHIEDDSESCLRPTGIRYPRAKMG